ncbi:MULTISPECIES: hypothetical protein [unclassified Stygiolobus]|uniref:hypothetical protein n=1 Tax=unclassified Stygiolobus TaxID=2824672 RepID=UPI00307D6918
MNRRLLLSVILLIPTLLMLFSQIPLSFAQTTSSYSTAGITVLPGTQVNPQGMNPPQIVLPTSTGSATYSLILINSRDSSAQVPVYLDSSLYTTVTLQPYSYKVLNLNLNTGLHEIQANGETFYVNVTQVNSAINGDMTLNGSANVYVFNAQPGHIYKVYYNVTSSLSSLSQVYASFVSNLANNWYGDVVCQASPSGTTGSVIFAVPQDIAQGLYYIYLYRGYEGFSNNVSYPAAYVYGLIIVNVSYGIPTTLSTPSLISENGVTLEVQNVSGYTYLQINYPFDEENMYTITVYTTSGTQTYTITNTSGGSYSLPGAPSGSYSAEVYGVSVPWAFSNGSITLKLPQFYKAIIQIKSPQGTVTITYPPTPISVATVNLEVLSTSGVPIPGAKVTLYNISNKQPISSYTTSPQGLVSITLPLGTKINATVSAPGYISNSTVIAFSQNETVKIYLTPIYLSFSITQLSEKLNNGTTVPITPSSILSIYQGATLNLSFKITTNSPYNVSVNATLNNVKIPVIMKNGLYTITYNFTNTNTYTLELEASSNGASNTTEIEIKVIPIVTSSPTPSTATSSTTTTTSHSTTTTTSTTSTTTQSNTNSTSTSTSPSVSVPPTSATSSSPNFVPILIIVAIIVIAAVVAIVILRK